MQIEFIQRLNKSDLNQIAKLHFHVLKESFINNFGINFLKIAYEGIISNPKNIFIVLRKKDEIYGFLVATEDDAQFNILVINSNFLNLIFEILKSFTKNPISILRLIPWFFSSVRFKHDLPELKFIAINPSLQRKGWGNKLLLKLNNEFKKRNIQKYRVGTKSINKNANNFYKKLGFKFLRKKKMFGDNFNFYISPSVSNTNTIFKQSFRQASMNSFKLSWILVIVFFIFFVIRSNTTMLTVPFYDFDEAHRAENAKKMAEYKSYLVPLTGSSQDRIEHLKIPLKENPVLHLYYHLERPFFVYLSMILSASIFGQTEWAYRLPSFVFGILTIFSFCFFAFCFAKKINQYALLTSVTALITSSDLWLSSQYAQMDTAITLFLFISLSLLILFCQNKRQIYLILSGFTFSLGVLSKGQPAVIFIFPLLFLILTKRLSLKDFSRFLIYATVLLLPWILYVTVKFGIEDVVKVFSDFAISSASIIYSHQAAPFFWYGRWWWESLRPGWTLFIALFLSDIIKHRLTWQKGVLLSYILGGLIAFSWPINKIWWYVLPLIPPLSLYVYLALNDYLRENKKNIINVILALLVASIPIFLQTTNRISLLYGAVTTLLVLVILNNEIAFNKTGLAKLLIITPKKFLFPIFTTVLLITLFFFYLRFPEINPYHRNTKPVALFYKNLPGKNCLWVYDMPTEAVLFYSNAGEVSVYNNNTILYGHCKHYLMSASPIEELYSLTGMTGRKLLYQTGDMKLFEL